MTEPEEEHEQQQRSSVGQSQEAQWTDEGKLVGDTPGPDNGRLLLCVIFRSSQYERKLNNFLYWRVSAGRGQVPGAALPHDGLLHAPLRHEPALQLPRGLNQRPRQQSDIGNIGDIGLCSYI